MNKLAVLAFAILLFLSSMLWYLANGSLNEYLKSQVLLQSHYYSGQSSQLLSADFSADTGVTNFTEFSMANIEGLSQPLLFSLDKISAQLTAVPSSELNAPSVGKRTTTLVHVETLTFTNLQAWSEQTATGETNLELLVKKISRQLATDYPALYPQLSAEIYAKSHPELNASQEMAEIDKHSKAKETNLAIIASKAAKKKKRLLGKAETRIIVSSVIIDKLTLTSMVNNNRVTRQFTDINLGSFGDKNGLDSNQLGGELLRKLLIQLISLEQTSTKTNTITSAKLTAN